METLIAGLVEKVGLDAETAQKVVDFLKEHADELPQMLASSGMADKLPGGLGGAVGSLGGMFGGD